MMATASQPEIKTMIIAQTAVLYSIAVHGGTIAATIATSMAGTNLI